MFLVIPLESVANQAALTINNTTIHTKPLLTPLPLFSPHLVSKESVCYKRVYRNELDNHGEEKIENHVYENRNEKTLVLHQGFLARLKFFFPFLPPFIAAFHAGTFI
jgi:hypothetical protein